MNFYRKSKNPSSNKLNKSYYKINKELSNYSLINDEININNKKEIGQAVKKFYDRDSGGHNDHINLSQENRNDKAAGTYLQVMDEITKKYPQYKDYFIEGIKDNSRNE